MSDPGPAVRHEMSGLSTRERVTTTFMAAIAAAVAAGVVVLTLLVLEDAFRRGATGSGLNPSGGGPGALLMAPSAILAFLAGRRMDRRGQLRDRITVVGVILVGMATVAVVVSLLGGLLLPDDFPSLEALKSAAVLAWAIPLVVMAVLAGR